MNIQAIAITNTIGVVLVIILLICSKLSRKRKSFNNHLFTCMLYIVASCCITETITFIIDGRPGMAMAILAEFTNTWLYFFNVSFSLLWCLYVDYHVYWSYRRLTTVYRPLIILTAILLLIILGNPIFHYLFSFGKNNIYHREPASYIFFLVPISYVMLSTVVVFRYKGSSQSLLFFPILAFLTPFLIGCILQVFLYGVSLAWCATAIGLTALYMCLQNEQVFKDPLTHLLNRHYLNTVLKDGTWNGRNAFSGIMIDVDHFKSINDNFGHGKGDEALCDVANILLENTPSDGATIRYAGDEFVLLLKATQRSDIKAVENKISEAVDSFNKTAGRMYTLSLSMGNGIYTPKQSTEDSFLEEIDQNMYENKRLRHLAGKLNDRRH